MSPRKYLALALFFSLTLYLTVSFRKYPVNFPQLKAAAQRQVNAQLQEQIDRNIKSQLPDLDGLAREQVTKVGVRDYRAKNRSLLKQEALNNYRLLKDNYQDKSGQTYLMELDCWHWARYTRNIILLGHPGDEVVGRRQFDTFMLAPTGAELLWDNGLYYFSAWCYKLFSLFNKSVPVYNFTFYLPLVYFEIFLILLYLMMFSRWGNIGASLSCLFIGLSPIVLRRTCAGWFDKDIFALIFPILIVWAYLEGVSKGPFRRRIMWALLAGFWTGLFCFTWIGWWFIVGIIAAYEIFSVLLIMFSRTSAEERSSKETARLGYFFAFIVFGTAWISLFCGLRPFGYLFNQIRSSLVLNSPFSPSIWPNVYSTVSELKSAGLREIVSNTGVPLFAASFISLFLLLILGLKKREYAGFRRELALLMVCWFALMFYSCFKGTRFILFLMVPLGIGLGAAISWCFSALKKKNKGYSLALFLFAFALVVTMVGMARNTAGGIYPMMDDTWYRFLLDIKAKTPSDAVINSWWDFGDWFKAVAERKVIFDGQSQDSPQAYWMAYVLMTDEEEEAVNILRMLNNGGNRAFEVINGELKDPFASALLLKKALNSTRSQAKERLLRSLTASCAEKVTGLIFDRPKSKAYFVVDYEMPRKIASISFLGSWDFAKAFLNKNGWRMGKEKSIAYLVRGGVDKKEAERYYREFILIPADRLDNWITHPLRFYSGPSKGEEKDGQVFFTNGLVYNPAKKTAYCYFAGENSYKLPASIFLAEKGRLEEVRFPKGQSDISALILKGKDGYRAYLFQQEFGGSLMARLYLLNGLGLKHFKPLFSGARDDNYLRIFEIDWGN